MYDRGVVRGRQVAASLAKRGTMLDVSRAIAEEIDTLVVTVTAISRDLWAEYERGVRDGIELARGGGQKGGQGQNG